MALSITVPQAAAIMMPILFVLDVMGLAAYRKDFDWALLRFLIPAGLLGTLAGTLLFKYLDARMVAGIVGALTLLFLAQRVLFPPTAQSRPPPKWVGALLTTLAGFTSFVAHAGGPAVNAYVLPMRLAPPVFTSTMLVFFFVLNLAKWVPYAWLGLLDTRNMATATAVALLPLTPIGIWLGVRLARRIKPALFYRLIHVGMFLTGCKLLWDAFMRP
jgi:hypothetical protein